MLTPARRRVPLARSTPGTIMNSPDLIAEAKRRLTGTPSLTEKQIDTWLAQVEAHGGRIEIAFDGSVFASYPRE